MCLVYFAPHNLIGYYLTVLIARDGADASPSLTAAGSFCLAVSFQKDRNKMSLKSELEETLIRRRLVGK